LPYKVACFAVAAPSGEVIDSRQNQTWFHLSPAVVKHVESGILEQAITALPTTGMELMVPGYCPHTEWSGKAAQLRQELKLRRIIAFDNVTAQNYDVRPLGLYLIDTRRQPILSQQRSEVEIRGEDEHCAVATGWQASKLYFVVLHNRCAQTLYKSNYAEHAASDERQPAQ
jgi:hypothetical protein